jgi:hypothetical protein
MKHIALVATLGVLATSSGIVSAKADCKAWPKAEWMKEADAKAKIESQGYRIEKFKVDGNCYEIYGTNKEGKKVEIYYDAKTLEPVKTEIKQ